MVKLFEALPLILANSSNLDAMSHKSLLNYCYLYNKLWHMTNSSAFNMNSHCISVILICFYHRLKGITNFRLPFIFKSVVPSNDAFHPHNTRHAAFLNFLLVLDTPLVS